MPISQQRLILVVDDDPYIINVFQKAFEKQGNFLLDIAMTIQLAIQKIKVVQYDLIFLDMKLGHSHAGMEVLRELRSLEVKMEAERNPIVNSLVVIMSGSITLNEITQEAHAMDVVCFIDKPVPMNEEFVRRVVNRLGLPLLPRRSVPSWPDLPEGNNP